MKQYNLLNESYIRARIIGIMLILIGAIIILINPTELYIKISFILILLGIFMIFIITEKSISKRISDVQVEGNMDTVNKIIKELHLEGNAIFLPRSDSLTEERIFIPPNKTGILRIPNVKEDNIILTAEDGNSLGISVPPAGLKLLREIEKDNAFKNITIDNLEEKLQLFVGMNLIKSISFKRQQYGWILEIENHASYNKDQDFHNQYPCPICSAILAMITRVLNEKIRIYNTTYNGRKITFNLNLIRKRV